jgi:hypothetical protein
MVPVGGETQADGRRFALLYEQLLSLLLESLARSQQHSAWPTG